MSLNVQVPPNSTGQIVRTVSADATTQQQVVVLGDAVTAANLAVVDASGRLSVISRQSDGTNLLSKLIDVDTSGSTHEYTQGINLRTGGSGGSVETGVSAKPLRVDPTGTTVQPVSGTVTTSPPSNASTNVAQLAGTATSVNSGTKDAGTLRVVIATDQPQLTNKLLVTPDALPANQSVNVAQVAGTTTDTNSGNKSAGTQRVVLATDQPALTTPMPVNATPATTGGLTIKHLVSAATTNATNVKASAGQVYGWCIFNTNAATRYVKLHNNAGTPTAGTAIVQTISVPPSGGSNFSCAQGIAFGTGIAFTTVTGTADSDATAVAANDLTIDIFYA